MMPFDAERAGLIVTLFCMLSIIFQKYHYYRNHTIYNEIRVLVSAYVWMTGFGHFLYCDKKQDFSIERMVSMWVRINYFPLLLSFFLNVKLELYYVVPLHTVGFFMTMATCYIAKLLREKRQDMDQAKSNMAAIVICLLVHVVFFETSLCKILGWISHEYEFRFATDKYSAWFGMLCGFLWSRFQAYMQWCYGDDDDGSSSNISSAGDAEKAQLAEQHSPQNKTQKPHKSPQKVQAMYMQRAAGVGLLAIWYFGFGAEPDKHVYNPRHPFVFWMPLAGWLMLRNSSKYLTELHSTVLEFMGRITLETYVLQFHVFMCQNVQHIPGKELARFLSQVLGSQFMYVLIAPYDIFPVPESRHPGKWCQRLCRPKIC
jgi:N-acetylneuraminate 9-O-acetyltransferase